MSASGKLTVGFFVVCFACSCSFHQENEALQKKCQAQKRHVKKHRETVLELSETNKQTHAQLNMEKTKAAREIEKAKGKAGGSKSKKRSSSSASGPATKKKPKQSSPPKVSASDAFSCFFYPEQTDHSVVLFTHFCLVVSVTESCHRLFG